MKLQGKLADISIDYTTQKPKLTFLINNNINSLDEIENVELLDIEIKKHRGKRSLNANSYFWKLLQELCELQELDAIEEYKKRVRTLGIFKRIRIEPKEVPTLKKTWENWGIAWWLEVADTEFLSGIEFKILHLYYGSSSFSSKQMARLIDDLVQDCEALGIPTKSEEEINSLIKEWGRNNGRNTS